MFDRKKIPLYKRIISYVNPVWLSFEESETTPFLEVLLYKNRIQLATKDALYSDGVKYTPALAIVNNDPDFIATVKDMLILGTGLGSMVQIVREMGYSPAFTLVELDKVILRLAIDVLEEDKEAKLIPVCADAQDHMANNTAKYDFIFIDIFDSRSVPAFVSTREFLDNCKKAIKPGGRLAWNYIVNNDEKWRKTKETFAEVFPNHQIINSEINRIFIALV